MSQLAVSFIKRQPRRDSNETLPSSVGDEIVREYERSLELDSGRGLAKMSPSTSSDNSIFSNKRKNVITVNINKSKNVRIGDEVKHVYQYYIMNDANNPAFILNDKNIPLRQKTLFVLGEKWCWGVILLLIFLISIAQTLTFILMPTETIIVTRQESGLGPVPEGLTTMRLPARMVVVAQTNDEAETCRSKDECIRRIRLMQERFKETLLDIPYNFLVGGDGRVYEGRGYQFQGELPRTSASFFDDIGLIVAFIGTFNDGNNQPIVPQKSVFRRFLTDSVRREALNVNFTLVSQDELVMTEPPAIGLIFMLGGFEEFHQLLHITNRQQWNAAPVRNESLIVLFDELHRNVTARKIGGFEPCQDFDECVEIFQMVQKRDFDLNFTDIRYNFMISVDGVFEGRGWDVRTDFMADKDSLSIGFSADRFYEPEFLNGTLSRLLEDGRVLGKISVEQIWCDGELCPIIEDVTSQRPEKGT